MSWEKGKPGGTLFKRKDGNCWNVVFQKEGKTISKTFSFKNYENEEEAYKEAKKFQIDKSKQLNLTKNMYRKLEDDTYWNNDKLNHPPISNAYEIHILHNDKDYYMLIDESDLHIIDKYAVVITKNSHKNCKEYACFSQKGTREDKKLGKLKNLSIHNYITGYKFVNHINRNPLDNRRCNLRESSAKLNNNNKGNVHKAKGILGVRFIQKDNAWQARIKQDNKEYTRNFSVNKYGNEEAKKLAIEARKQFNREFNCTNGEDDEGNLIEN